MPDRVVAVFVGTRADLGPLAPVITAIADAPDLTLRVLTGVMYAADDLAAALPGPRTAEEWRPLVRPLADPMKAVTADAQVAQGARLAAGVGRAVRDEGIDVIVVLGDRWELLDVVPPAFLLGVPIVHLHGGEVTEGAVDERIRHAVTKLADEHCVASADAATRLRQLGEPEQRVHVTGAPGLDRLTSVRPMSDHEIACLTGLPAIQRPLALFTYHPATTAGVARVGPWSREALEATLEVCGTVIATHPGMDAGREGILAALDELGHAHADRLAVVPALGRDYPRVLAAVDVVVGNSSSGIIEAATVRVPAVDVGDRQLGRLRGENVLHSREGRSHVAHALREALSPDFRERTGHASNPYGTGEAAERILDIVRRAGSAGRAKPFVDLDCTQKERNG
ncbi:UDP-N-acetyl-D-glucosamine 2-epimerase [Intrasporangium chromatireducens Q5-1]|uniref:UDP-N-acetyl-D-glucosamine 2-epimerase n=1 Tax=Intrasporangium chromatireducens Q5-1 TaxID=584657 RepID=W9GMT4_9MICO|nr:UDP-N-acetylglucosamine 2-epimerase [Intrasporangium chromatireducens]EWT07551.1 UDP-N-acetyl-D-glucosamine 2-epimerase [Intrasporangium chromatireducens Q5-1]